MSIEEIGLTLVIKLTVQIQTPPILSVMLWKISLNRKISSYVWSLHQMNLKFWEILEIYKVSQGPRWLPRLTIFESYFYFRNVNFKFNITQGFFWWLKTRCSNVWVGFQFRCWKTQWYSYQLKRKIKPFIRHRLTPKGECCHIPLYQGNYYWPE